MNTNDKALHLNTLLYKSQLKIERLLAYSNQGIYYLAISYANGKPLLIKELFSKDCIRRIDGSVDIWGVNPKEFKQLIQNFAQIAETLRQNRQIEDYFEENGTIYYLCAWVAGQAVQDYPIVPTDDANFVILEEAQIASESFQTIGISSNWQNESWLNMGESLISSTESLFTDTSSVLSPETNAQMADNQVFGNIDNAQIINEENPNLAIQKPAKKTEEVPINAAKKISQELKESEEKNKSPFQKWSDESDKKSKHQATYQPKHTAEGFVTLPSIDQEAAKTNQKSKNKTGSYKEFDKNLQAGNDSKLEKQLQNQAKIVKPKKTKSSGAWFWWLVIGGFVLYWWLDFGSDSSTSPASDSKPETESQKYEKLTYTQFGPFSEGLQWGIRGGRVGFLDSSAVEVIAAQYDAARDFKEGMAWVKLGVKIGFVDKTGREVVKIDYDGARDFSEGMAWVKRDNRIGYVNKQGIEVIPPKYEGAFDFKNGLGKVILNKKYGFVNSEGKEIIALIYDDMGDFANDRVWAMKDGKMGYLDPKGQIAIPFGYESGGSFSENRAWVIQNGKRGFIDPNGKAITPLKYEGTRNFSNGMAWVLNNALVGFVNLEGKEVIPLQYTGAWDFSEDLAGAISGGKVGFIDKTGNWVIRPQFDDIDSSFVNGVAKVKQNGISFFINRQGQKVSENINNTTTSQSGKYDTKSPYMLGVAIVSKNGKYGLINENEHEITILKYDFIDAFSQGLAAFRRGGLWGYLNKSGEEVIKAEFVRAYPFSEGLAMVQVGEKYGFINLQGKLIIPAIYSQAGSFREGLARAQLNNRRFGYITPQGGIAIPFTFQEAGDFLNGKAMVKADGKDFFIDKSGKCIRNCR
ncbi:MAG: WG repeat-containing protein [Microscillaceae bacterium]|nr:WG repeat-containing protein [Microscillaceae bacterium]